MINKITEFIYSSEDKLNGRVLLVYNIERLPQKVVLFSYNVEPPKEAITNFHSSIMVGGGIENKIFSSFYNIGVNTAASETLITRKNNVD